MGRGGGPTSTGGGMPKPVTMALIAGSIMQGLGALKGDPNVKINKKQLELARDTFLAELLKERAATEQENVRGEKRAKAMSPLLMDLVEKFKGPSSASVAKTRGRSFATRDEEGRQAVSTQGPGGEAASDEELDQLMPDFERFKSIRNEARAAAQGFTPDQLHTPRQTILEQMGYGNDQMIGPRLAPGRVPGSGVQQNAQPSLARSAAPVPTDRITGDPQQTAMELARRMRGMV